MNTEYTIIPVCIPDNDTEFLKVSGFSISIWERDDETGRLIDTMKAEQDAIKKVADCHGWKGKLDFVYGISTAGGIGDKQLANMANEKIISKLAQCTRIDYIRGNY